MIPEHESINREAICLTQTLTDVASMIEDCREHRAMGLIVGAPGTGKTTAIEYARWSFEREFGFTSEDAFNRGVEFMIVTGSEASGDKPRLFLEAVCESLPNPQYYGYASQNLRYLVDRLRLTVGSVIVVDEAQKLGRGALEVLRELHDAVNVGVVMVENERFNKQFRRDDLGQYAHIASRITRRLPRIESVSEVDFLAICTHRGILEISAIDALRPFKVGSGGLRHVVAIIDVAQEIAGQGKPITARHIAAAVSSMGIEK